MDISHLPQDLYRNIQEYTSINPLLNTTQKLSNIKYESYYWKLNSHWSRKYRGCSSFRSKVNDRMSKTLNQLSLDLSGNKKLTDVSMLENVHTLNLSHCKNLVDVSMLGKVHNLDMSYCKGLRGTSELKNVHNLDLYGSYEMPNKIVTNTLHINPSNFLFKGSCKLSGEAAGKIIMGLSKKQMDLSGSYEMPNKSVSDTLHINPSDFPFKGSYKLSSEALAKIMVELS